MLILDLLFLIKFLKSIFTVLKIYLGKLTRNYRIDKFGPELITEDYNNKFKDEIKNKIENPKINKNAFNINYGL